MFSVCSSYFARRGCPHSSICASLLSHHTAPFQNVEKARRLAWSTQFLKAPPPLTASTYPLTTHKPLHTSQPLSLALPYHTIVAMPPFYEISVASFRQPSSAKSKWAIAVVFSSSSGHSLVYQIVGSTADYSLDAPQSVTLKEGENGYVGKTPVGLVDSEKLHQLHSTLASIPVMHGNPGWNSHSWVMEGIFALRKLEGYHIDKHVTPQWVSERLGEK